MKETTDGVGPFACKKNHFKLVEITKTQCLIELFGNNNLKLQ
jgi:hypothetical protein